MIPYAATGYSVMDFSGSALARMAGIEAML
jgi:hypothetical protein